MKSSDMLVGRGRTADIYAHGSGLVIKLFFAGFPAESIKRELQMAEMASCAGLPVPEVHGTTTHHGRRGIVYEKVEGVTLTRWAIANPVRIRRAGELLAQLHLSVHQVAPHSEAGIPTQRQALERALSKAELPDDVRQAAPRLLESLPSGDVLCHGDFHPDNVIMSARGPMIIDWMTATRGAAAVDVARTWIILSTPALPPGMPLKPLVRLIRSRFCKAYLNTYLRLSHISQADLSAGIAVIAAARLAEKIAGEREYLLRAIRRQMV